MTNNYYCSVNNNTLPSELENNDMVQRQRADPGGSRGGIRMASGEPDAAVIQVKGDNQKMALTDVVVDAIDSRHVVDEIRDNSLVDDRQKDGMEALIDLTKTMKEDVNLPGLTSSIGKVLVVKINKHRRW